MTRDYWWEPWMEQGACTRIYEWEMMCDPKRVAEARAVCAVCEVRPECFNWAIDQAQEWCVHAGVQFTHEIKRLIGTKRKAGAIMANVRLMNSVTAYGNVGDIVDLPAQLAASFIAAEYAEAVEGESYDVEPTPAPVDEDVTTVIDEEEAEIQALLDADADPGFVDELPADHTSE